MSSCTLVLKDLKKNLQHKHCLSIYIFLYMCRTYNKPQLKMRPWQQQHLRLELQVDVDLRGVHGHFHSAQDDVKCSLIKDSKNVCHD